MDLSVTTVHRRFMNRNIEVTAWLDRNRTFRLQFAPKSNGHTKINLYQSDGTSNEWRREGRSTSSVKHDGGGGGGCYGCYRNYRISF